jgi:signal transduction histidine kinase
MDTLYGQFVSPLEFQGTEYLMAMDDKGTVIMHPESGVIGLNAFAELERLPPESRPEGLAAMLERQYGYEEGTSIYRSLSGQDEINAYTRVNATGGATFMISSAMPLSQALRPVNDNLGRFALLTAVLFATVASAAATIYTLQKKRQRLALQARYLQDINNTLEELHESREQLRHYQKLQTIGALAGGIVHEFNNLLTPIMGYCEFLLERMGKASEYAEDLEEIYKAGSRAKEIIRQILPFSRRESDTSGYTAVSVDAILRDAAKTVRMVLPSSISFEEDYRAAGINVFGSATQLNQVLLNLCTNAYQAMEQGGGVLRLGCRLVLARELPEQHRASASGSYVALEVADTGCGMAPDIAEKVFGAFFTTKPIGEGTGLGLSVVQNIVQDHKGFIALDTAPGQGSRFYVYLPTTSAPVLPKAAAMPPQEGPARKLSVLVVDDEERILRYLKKRLQRGGHVVDAHTSPEIAMAAFQSAPEYWDLVILDYMMPLCKGTELALQMKKQKPELPIILITGLVEKEALQMKREGILREILIKPLDYRELLQALKRI